MLWEFVEYADRPMRICTDLGGRASKLGLPPPTNRRVPTEFHRRVTFSDGFEDAATADLGLLVIGPDTPREVARESLRHVVDGGIVAWLARSGLDDPLPCGRNATPVLQSGELLGARLCP